MNKEVFKRSFFKSFLKGIMPIIFTSIMVGIVWLGIGQANEANSEEGIRILEDAIFRAAIHNYAVAGYFPENLAYIIENFNIYVDTTRFVVHYDAFAPNLPPRIIVFPLN